MHKVNYIEKSFEVVLYHPGQDGLISVFYNQDTREIREFSSMFGFRFGSMDTLGNEYIEHGCVVLGGL